MNTAPQFKITAHAGDEYFEWFTRDSKEASRIARSLKVSGKYGEFYRLNIDRVIVSRFRDGMYVPTRTMVAN